MTQQIENKEQEEEQLIDGGKVMSLFDHLVELRQRIVKSLIAVLIFFGIAMAFSTEIIEFLKQPLLSAIPQNKDALHFTGPLDVFITSIKVGFLTAIIFACPVWIYQFWRFIEPALYKHERKYILPFVFASVGLFVAGVSFCYYAILPLALEFLITLGMEVGTPIITITDYVSMLMLMIFGFGFIFETPLILVLLAILDLVSAEMLAKYRRYVLVGILFVGAILTPPDPLSQVGMAIPLYLMYEFSILIIRMIKKKSTT
ncbi:MAG: twin-arginine translocase subunit TatC [Oligoflexales bacterium]|nr:twin-arginine translocase subunit TatC [Oligoflexales bacterium]